MAQSRVETVWDNEAGGIKIEQYYPNDSKELMVVSPPVFGTHEEALARAVDLLKDGIPNAPIKVIEAGFRSL